MLQTRTELTHETSSGEVKLLRVRVNVTRTNCSGEDELLRVRVIVTRTNCSDEDELLRVRVIVTRTKCSAEDELLRVAYSRSDTCNLLVTNINRSIKDLLKSTGLNVFSIYFKCGFSPKI